jgi:hypothetical protein
MMVGGTVPLLMVGRHNNNTVVGWTTARIIIYNRTAIHISCSFKSII